MSLTLRRNESVPVAVQRVGRQRIDRVIQLLDLAPQAGGDQAIHAARKQIKQLRALLRLVRRDIGCKQCHRLDKRLRQVVRALSPLRDSTVLLATLLRLHRRGALRSDSLMALKCAIQIGQNGARNQIRSTSGQRKFLAATLRDTRRQIAHWSGIHPGWKAISSGLRHIYRSGRAAVAALALDASDEALHKARKRTMDLLYTMEFLQKMQPRSMRARADATRRLTSCLGNDHDLAVLTQALRRTLHRHLTPAELNRLTTTAALRRRALQLEVPRLARGVYAQTEETFVRRIHRHWKRWRGPLAFHEACLEAN
jgi:CHAD domain-containing protein